MFALIPMVLNFLIAPVGGTIDASAPEAKQVTLSQREVSEDIKNFIEPFFGVPSDQVVVKNHSSPGDLAETGLIEGGIYFIETRKGKPIGVLKVMPRGYEDDEQLFEKEFTSLDKLRSTAFKDFHYIEIVGRGEGEVRGERALILAEKVAPGRSMNQLLKEYPKKTSAKGKQQILDEIEGGVRSSGRALGELHAKSPKWRANSSYARQYDDKLPGPYGWIHGDAHPGNIFYDQKNDQVTFIDFQMMPSLDIGGPVGVDVANFLATMDILGAYKQIPKEERLKWREIFFEAYSQTGPKLHRQDVLFYEEEVYKRYAKLPEDGGSGPDAHQVRFIHHYCTVK